MQSIPKSRNTRTESGQRLITCSTVMSNVSERFLMLPCVDAPRRASLCGDKQRSSLGFRKKVAFAQRSLAAPGA
jgi:hypothetical protein